VTLAPQQKRFDNDGKRVSIRLLLVGSVSLNDRRNCALGGKRERRLAPKGGEVLCCDRALLCFFCLGPGGKKKTTEGAPFLTRESKVGEGEGEVDILGFPSKDRV